MRITAVIDRFEEQKAVLLLGETEAQVSWPQSMLPDKVSEGAVLNINITIDEQATVAARAEAAELLRSVLEQNKRED